MGLLAPPLDPSLVRGLADATVMRVRALPDDVSSRRAALYYVLYEVLREVDPDLFPPSAVGPRSDEPTGPQRGGRSFAEVVPDMTIKGVLPETVAATVAHQIFGFE
jgi:hypothetical protein